MKIRLLLCFVALGLFSFNYITLNQVFIIDDIINKLKLFYEKSPVEKIYLHTDKSFYVAGETVWLKAYLQNSQSDTSDLSKVLYVELISPYAKIQESRQLFINQLSTFGEIDLADTLSEGIYHLRAYTSHLRNVGNEYFFDKQIKIYHPKSTPKSTAKVSQDQNIDLQFFPEGGELIYGLRSTVGFKAMNVQGLGIQIEGEIYDNEGIKAATFKSNALGIGSFKLVPSLNRIYQAKIKLASGREASYYLPNVKQSGFVMNLENMPENRLRLRVFANHNGLEGKAKNFFVIAQQNGEVFYSVKDSTGKTALMSDIPKRVLPQGIVHFTLFDGNGYPQAERLVFVNHQDFLQFSIGKDKESYSPKEKVNLSIFIADAQGNSAETDFSIAVTDLGKVDTVPQEDNILTNLLLTSELKGNIESPNFYLQNTPESQKALDDLMLTQGWRRFRWKELINNELVNNFYKIEKGITVSGFAKGGLGAPFKNANVSLLSISNGIALTGKTDGMGQFEISNLNFEGDTELAIQIENDKKTKAEKIAITPFSPPAIDNKNMPFMVSFTSALRQTIDNTMPSSYQSSSANKNIKTLESVTVSSTPITDSDVYASMKPYGTADATIRNEALVINAKGTNNVLFGLKGQAAGVQIGRDANGNFGVLIRGGINSLQGSSTALLLFDGIPVDFNFFNSVSPEDIDHIDIIKSEKATAYGARGANGAIAAFSRRNYKTVDKSVGLINETVRGYHIAREFYSPSYETMKKEERNKPDMRNTIYWNPKVLTNPNGVANISFFASQTPTKYRIVIEGRSWKGKLGRKEVVIEVKK